MRTPLGPPHRILASFSLSQQQANVASFGNRRRRMVYANLFSVKFDDIYRLVAIFFRNVHEVKRRH